jgi:arylsulfatase A-like enzyme
MKPSPKNTIRAVVRALAACVGLAAGAHAAEKPNIVFFFSDDHTRQAISAYGSEFARTPNIDRIAARGMRFDRLMATNAICAPSRATVLTGAYSHVNGKYDNHGSFDGSQPTLPKMLQAAGYQTAIFGKWHLASTPTGFDDFGILDGQGQYNNPVWLTPVGREKREGYVSDVITDETLKWLGEKRVAGKPFFVMVNHKAPHGNWVWHPRYEGVYPAGSIPQPPTLFDDFATRTSTPVECANKMLTIGKSHLTTKPPAGLTGKALIEWNYNRYISDYLRTAQSVDDGVGRVLDWLEANGLADNTLVIYSSDQGFFLGEHGLFDKRLPYDEALIMPFLMCYPKAIKPGTASDALLGNHDILPTLADYAGGEVPARVQGRSFRAVAEGGRPPAWTESFYYRFYEKGWGITSEIEAVRTRTHKLIHYIDKDEWELYDLEADPREMKNLAANPEHASLREKMTAELVRLREHYGAPAEPRPAPKGKVREES